MSRSTLFSDLLRELGVRHTDSFSDRQFRSMSFKSLFGLSRLLTSYGIDNAAFQIADPKELLLISTPFVAQKGHSFVVVTDVKPDSVKWLANGLESEASPENFLSGCPGVVLQAYPSPDSAEPDYARHHFLEIAAGVKRWLLTFSLAALFIIGFIFSGMWRNLSTILLSCVNLGGLAVTWLLILKSLKVKSAAADSVCGVLQKHGCDHVLEDKASSFFGLFGWSEVGFTYFSVSTAILFLFPEMISTLALINGCCLPFTLWSIWYQKFRIKTWCTLCVITQCLLWCQFFCYLLGGWWKTSFPISPWILAAGVAYLAVLLSINAVCSFIKKQS